MNRKPQRRNQSKAKGRSPKITAPQDEVVALEANRSFLEQFEELAAADEPGGPAAEWLTKEIYQRPDRLSVLANMRGRKENP